MHMVVFRTHMVVFRTKLHGIEYELELHNRYYIPNFRLIKMDCWIASTKEHFAGIPAMMKLSLLDRITGLSSCSHAS